MEQEILELEKEYWAAMENRDFNTVKRLTRFPCIVAGKNGIRLVDEESFKAMFDSSENLNLKVIEISSVDAQFINNNTAIIGYQINQEYAIEKEIKAFNCVCTSTWIKENDQWICAMHTETELTK